MNEISPSDIIQWQNAIRTNGYSQTYLRMVQNQITAILTITHVKRLIKWESLTLTN